MATFTLIRELLDLERDRGSKRLLLGLYESRDDQRTSRYIALSEQKRVSAEAPWVSAQKGITLRRGELEAAIKALQSADFDSAPDTSGLSAQEYALTLDWT